MIRVYKVVDWFPPGEAYFVFMWDTPNRFLQTGTLEYYPWSNRFVK